MSRPVACPPWPGPNSRTLAAAVGAGLANSNRSRSVAGRLAVPSASDIVVADVRFGASAPEPAACALMLVGFGGLGVAIRARRKIAAAVV